MLCLPGLTPVANDAHAVGDSGECVVASGRTPPAAESFEMLGSWPSRSQRSTSFGSMPSKPRMTSFGRPVSGGGVAQATQRESGQARSERKPWQSPVEGTHEGSRL